MRRSREAGFTMIELLIAVAIIGLITAIAIPQYSVYKASSVDSSMKTDLRNAMTAMESYYVQNDETYVGATDSATLEDYGFRPTAGVNVAILSATPTSFSLRSCTSGGTQPAWAFDSEVGKIVGDAGSC